MWVIVSEMHQEPFTELTSQVYLHRGVDMKLLLCLKPGPLVDGEDDRGNSRRVQAGNTRELSTEIGRVDWSMLVWNSFGQTQLQYHSSSLR